MQPVTRKNKIELANYDYLRDIEIRLLMAQLSAIEVDILKEIINNSLKFTISQLADSLGIETSVILPLLHKLTLTKLLQINQEKVSVDKELRKYYEIQILKFDDDFEPRIEFFQSILSGVPIHILPNWYAISRCSESIIQSIIEKYLLTPKIYENYLQELTFDDPEVYNILNDVMHAPDFKISSRDLIAKYKLSHKCFEKYMLILEFSFACCLMYEKRNGVWEEIVTPFHEWREYLNFLHDTKLKEIAPAPSILRVRSQDFCFINDLNVLVKAIQTTPLLLDFDSSSNQHSLPLKTASKVFPDLIDTVMTPFYLQQLVEKAVHLQIVFVSELKLHPSDAAAHWLKLHIQDQAISVFRLPPLPRHIFSRFSEKDSREIEKSVRRVIRSGWVSFDHFFAGLTAPISNTEPVSLKNKGKRWKYVCPVYSTEEREFVQTIICEKLFESGMVSIGFYGDQLCFCVTPFGRTALSG